MLTPGTQTYYEARARQGEPFSKSDRRRRCAGFGLGALKLTPFGLEWAADASLCPLSAVGEDDESVQP